MDRKMILDLEFEEQANESNQRNIVELLKKSQITKELNCGNILKKYIELV